MGKFDLILTLLKQLSNDVEITQSVYHWRARVQSFVLRGIYRLPNYKNQITKNIAHNKISK